MEKKINIGDIARELNISKTTVSFVINGKAREHQISILLERKILDYVQKIGYTPNLGARSLRTGQTKVIVMLIDDISDPFFSSVVQITQQVAFQRGYSLFVSSTANNGERTKELIAMYRTFQVDGYIIAPPQNVETELIGLIDDGLPVVLFDRTLPGPNIHHVVIDNYQASYDAIRHLIKNGYRNTAMITLNSGQFQIKERERGYLQALKEARLPHLIKEVAEHQDEAGCITQILEFLNEQQDVDSVFFVNGVISKNGLGAVKYLKSGILEGFGIVVFDDHDFFRLFRPSVSAVVQPVKEIAERATNLLIELLSGSVHPEQIQSIVIPAALVIRESTLPKINCSNSPCT